MRGAAHALACIVLVLVTAGAAEARQARDPFTRGTVSLEFDAAFLGELWHLNERRESIGEGAASVWGAVAEGVSIGVEFHHLRVIQRGSDAFVQGISPLVRWRFVDRGRWAMFAELGPGVSWSDVPTPPRGTKFNYLFQGSVGFLRQLGAGSRASFGVRFLHLSNNEREGVDRNPDLEMLGPFAGFSFSF
jgi:hypothetical protein